MSIEKLDSTQMGNEYEYKGMILNGFVMLGIWICLCIFALCLIFLVTEDSVVLPTIGAVLLITLLICTGGFFVQEPNQARVFIFAGKYYGSCRKIGYNWVNPFFTKKKISLRISNMDVQPIKVNDKVGNPVLIGMVLVWRVKDTYKVVFDLNSMDGAGGKIDMGDLQLFVRIQSDAALRELTSCFPYDPEGKHDEITLRNGGDHLNEMLERKINERLVIAGLEVIEARINYLAYAPEIAAVMLRRQQASAIISAREKIVEGAVSMVDMALNQLETNKIVSLDNASKAALISNLMVVLCADEPANPVINAGV